MTDPAVLRPLIARCARAVYDGHEHLCIGDEWVDTTCARPILEHIADLLGIPGVRDLQAEVRRFDHPDEDRSAACG